MAHFIPLRTQEHIKELALTFVKQIWPLHGLPESIVSDRDTRFTSKFWTSRMHLLQVKLHLSTAFYPEIDWQTERVNQTREYYLRSYCSYQHHDWVSLWPFAEHAYNTSMSGSTKACPFEINYGFSLQTQWSGIESDNKGIHPDTELVMKHWEDTWQEIQETIQQAQERHQKWQE